MDIRIITPGTVQESEQLIRETGADPYAVARMADKAVFRCLLLDGVDNRAAAIIKQEMLALGSDAAINSLVSRFIKGSSKVLLMGTLRQYSRLLEKLSGQPFGLKLWAEKIRVTLNVHSVFSVPYGRKTLTLAPGSAVMGILNCTPDSFSDGGDYFDPARAVAHAVEMQAMGASIIDVGGESTRPGSPRVSAKEETARVVPIIKAVRRALKVPLSIDTYKPEVAEAALDAGADIINDIAGLRFKKGAMARVAAQWRAPVIIMHMRGTPRTMQKHPRYRDVVAEVTDFFHERVQFARECGVADRALILDPGIGFGKTVAHNLVLLRRLSEFAAMGYPLCVGTSRKGFVGVLSGEKEPSARVAGSLATFLWAAFRGAHIVRVHDVRETVQALSVLLGIIDTKENP